MPKHDLNHLDHKQEKRIETLVKNTKKMKREDLTEYLQSVNDDYERTMNKIIFDTHLVNNNQDLIPHNLSLPPKPEKEAVPEYGLIALPRDKIT
jgi:hypothetical protein